MEIEIKTAAQFQEEIKQGKVLVDFYATWCGPCQMLSPLIAELADAHPEIKVLRIDVDENPDLAGQFFIRSIPTLLLFENGEKKDERLGFMPKPALERFVGIA